jgi:hypothetical protein
MEANFTGRRLRSAVSSVIIHARGFGLKYTHLLTFGGFDEGLRQLTADITQSE